jgi:predicted RNase H-like nuclease
MFDQIERAFSESFERLIGVANPISVGVDWCGGKWIAAELEKGCASFHLFDDIDSLCAAYAHCSYILIDAPVGLPENNAEALKRPDRAAREYLKVSARKSSIFPVPFRQLVYETDKKIIWDMSHQLGAKITPQSIAIFPTIRQVDAFLSEHPEWHERLVESHPECAFQALNGNVGLQFSKHEEAGRIERMEILSRFVDNIGEVLETIPKKWHEDALDALSLAMTASRQFESIQPTVYCDSRGIPMRIVISR